MNTTPTRKKLIEVAMPLEAINTASAREKSIRHGHPSTLHLWWARRPLAACRAVIFGQLVDDPSSWPDRFPTKEDQDAERDRLHDVIRNMVEWPGSKAEDQARWERALDAARIEIARSVAWARGDTVPEGRGAVLTYLAEHAPPVYDPFSGGGSIPLEAQRLGLRAYGSDLNPVPVLISKALVEIPPKFAGMAPVHPGAERSVLDQPWRGAEGLAEDVRYYGRWMREQAKTRIGHLYPDVTLPSGKPATIIAWLWARTVRSPDPAAKGAMVPLASSFVLSSKPGNEAVVRVVHDASDIDGWRFEVRQGGLSTQEIFDAKDGTKAAKGFTCVVTGAPITNEYVRREGKAKRLGQRLMAIVAEKDRGRAFLSPDRGQEKIADGASPVWRPETLLDPKALGFRVPGYGLNTYGDMFTDRHLVALTTFCDLVGEARERIKIDAKTALQGTPLASDVAGLPDGGQGAEAYADAVSTYLGLTASKLSAYLTTQSRWRSGESKSAPGFARQAIPMVWDFAETNPFAGAGGDWEDMVIANAKLLQSLGTNIGGSIYQIDAASNGFPVRPVAISTDPPYYDNIGYADLSDYFYVWLRRSLTGIWQDLFRRIQTPKTEELVATPHRAPSQSEMAKRVGNENHPILLDWDKLSPSDRAERTFMFGMSQALIAVRNASASDVPLAIYYAFKQSEKSEDGVSSAGWASFLQAVVDAGLLVDGTWPMRTENATRMRGHDSNALASSIVLICRPRPLTARTVSRRDFLTELRRKLPEAVARMRAAGIHPVDIPQAALGPGMEVFSQYAAVREADDSAMSVGRAITLINQVRGEIDHAESGDLDASTRFALDWFQSYGWNAHDSGKAIQAAQAYNLTERELREGGILIADRGEARLMRRFEMASDWRPSRDRSLTAWEVAQALNRALNDGGGVAEAGGLLAEAREMTGAVHWLTARLFALAEDRRMTDEARGWGHLSEAWAAIEAAADQSDVVEAAAMNRAKTGDLF
jgi:putative DNA methylase